MKYKLSIFFAVIFIAMSAQAKSDKISDKTKATHIAQIMADEKEKNDLNAIIAGVWIGNKEILTKAIGNSITDVPADKDMHFRAGAVTISYLTTLLLQLVDQGKVSLDDKLSKWFPQYPHSDQITLRMLANSTSGYPDYVYSKEFVTAFPTNVFMDFATKKYVNLMVSRPLEFEPGKGWGYSHTNFVILGQVLEKVTGQPVSQLLKKNILEKLRLRDTDYPANPEIAYPVLHAFTSERGVYEDSTYWNPAWTSYSGMMTSNLEDLGKWTRVLGAGNLISRKSYQEMISPVTAHFGKGSPDLYYGLGVIMANSWIVQDARFGGYNVTIAYLPSQKITIDVVATIGQKSSSNISYSKNTLKEIAKYLVPDHALPEKA